MEKKVKKPRDHYFFSPVKRKVFLLLSAGVALGLTQNINKQYRILRAVRREWETINRQYLYAIIHEFKNNRLIDYKEHDDGLVTITITEKGKRVALKFHIDEMVIPTPQRWDGKWRIVIFDIPEKLRRGRDALREKLKDLMFYELQRSVWIHPYPCNTQINFIVEFFDLRRYVRLGELVSLTLEEELLVKWNLKKSLTTK